MGFCCSIYASREESRGTGVGDNRENEREKH